MTTCIQNNCQCLQHVNWISYPANISYRTPHEMQLIQLQPVICCLLFTLWQLSFFPSILAVKQNYLLHIKPVNQRFLAVKDLLKNLKNDTFFQYVPWPLFWKSVWKYPPLHFMQIFLILQKFIFCNFACDILIEINMHWAKITFEWVHFLGRYFKLTLAYRASNTTKMTICVGRFGVGSPMTEPTYFWPLGVALKI